MAQRIAIAFGAGIVAALLLAVSTKATALAIALPYLSPLPIMIAALNWGVDMGALAALTACGGAAALMGVPSAALVGVAIVLPAWALSALAGLRVRSFNLGKANALPTPAWFPVGLIVAAAAVIGALIGLAALISLIVAYSGFDHGVEEVSRQISPLFQERFGDIIALPAGVTVDQFANEVVRQAPPVLAPLAFLLFCGNLYVAGRVAQISQSLNRPWPDLPESLRLPRALGVALLACLVPALLLRDAPQLAAWIVVGVFATAFALQGMALAHALTRGFQPYRIPLLFLLYVVLYLGCALAPQWILPLLALAGLAESFLSLRAKRLAATNAKPLNHPES